MDGKPAGMTANVPHGTIKFSRKEELCVAKIVAIANQKGGVGKTTTAVNLSSCVAALGKRVLIVDLDPQGNTTTGYGIPKRSVGKGTYEILIGEARASEAIRKTEYRTDVIGSNTRLAGASLEMIDLPARESRVQEISSITRNLKIMAKEMNVPIIALSQLSRAVEKQGNNSSHRPQLSDLRDSGSIEQDADCVLFLYRDSYYASQNPDGAEVDADTAECIVAKNRHGETSTVPLGWDGAHTRFMDVDFKR